jgi:hypothetical protein
MIKKKESKTQYSKYILFVCFLIFCSTYIANKHVISEAAGSDSAGYLLNAKTILGNYSQKNLIPTEFPQLPCATLDNMLTARVEIIGECEKFSRLASYPTGLGIMHAVSIKFFGDNNIGRGFSMAFSYIATMLIIYFFTRDLTRNRNIALFAVVSFALAKQVIWSVASNISDLPGGFWVLFTTYFMYKLTTIFEQKKVVNSYLLRYSIVFILACSFWMTFLTREVNILTLTPLFFVFWSYKNKVKLMLIVSIFITGIPALYIRYLVNGVLFTDSYGGSLWNVFSSEWFNRSAGNIFYLYISTIGIALLVVFLYLKNMQKIEWILYSQILISSIFYSFYQFTGETWWYGRFLLNVLPSLIVLASSRLIQLIFDIKDRISKKINNSLVGLVQSYLVIVIIISVILVNNTLKFNRSSDYYDFLINDLPKTRQTEPVISLIRQLYPDGANIVTMHLSAAGRYYLNSQEYKFLWKPELEKQDPNLIIEYFPKTIWIFNDWDLPPQQIRDRLVDIVETNSFTISELQ